MRFPDQSRAAGADYTASNVVDRIGHSTHRIQFVISASLFGAEALLRR
jgi:hypothetical protein